MLLDERAYLGVREGLEGDGLAPATLPFEGVHARVEQRDLVFEVIHVVYNLSSHCPVLYGGIEAS
jgi:hypothetical protein